MRRKPVNWKKVKFVVWKKFFLEKNVCKLFELTKNCKSQTFLPLSTLEKCAANQSFEKSKICQVKKNFCRKKCLQAIWTNQKCKSQTFLPLSTLEKCAANQSFELLIYSQTLKLSVNFFPATLFCWLYDAEVVGNYVWFNKPTVTFLEVLFFQLVINQLRPKLS